MNAGIPVTTDTRFDIASVSKQFTATAILMLQREGKLSLADPIANYVDGLPDWGASVTLDQLMHQTSRIPDYWVELDDIDIGFAYLPEYWGQGYGYEAAAAVMDHGLLSLLPA